MIVRKQVQNPTYSWSIFRWLRLKPSFKGLILPVYRFTSTTTTGWVTCKRYLTTL